MIETFTKLFESMDKLYITEQEKQSFIIILRSLQHVEKCNFCLKLFTDILNHAPIDKPQDSYQ